MEGTPAHTRGRRYTPATPAEAGPDLAGRGPRSETVAADIASGVQSRGRRAGILEVVGASKDRRAGSKGGLEEAGRIVWKRRSSGLDAGRCVPALDEDGTSPPSP